MSFQLGPDTFLCKSARHYVFLDLQADEYISVNAIDFDKLLPWLNTRSATSKPFAASSQEIPREILEIAKPFLDRGLLRIEVDEGGRNFVRFLPGPRRSFRSLVGEDSLPSSIRRHWFQFLVASTQAHVSLSRDPISVSVAKVLTRREKSSNAPWKVGDAIALVNTFNELRPFFPRKYLCLFDSLAMVNFLAHFGIHPHWVFGVCAEPFSAHCWVQWDDIVLNDSVEIVCGYTPIMVA